LAPWRFTSASARFSCLPHLRRGALHAAPMSFRSGSNSNARLPPVQASLPNLAKPPTPRYLLDRRVSLRATSPPSRSACRGSKPRAQAPRAVSCMTVPLVRTASAACRRLWARRAGRRKTPAPPAKGRGVPVVRSTLDWEAGCTGRWWGRCRAPRRLVRCLRQEVCRKRWTITIGQQASGSVVLPHPPFDPRRIASPRQESGGPRSRWCSTVLER